MGGGPVGCHIAISLLRLGVAFREDVTILDPRPLMSLWRTRTQNCGMRYLRSSCVHHLGAKPSDLSSFQKRRWTGTCWRGKASCPSLALFNAHSASLIERWGLEKLRRAAKVEAVIPKKSFYRLSTDQGDIEGKSVVLALGPSWERKQPSWLKGAKERVFDILDPKFASQKLKPGSKLAILGAGMTAVQAALRFAETHAVTLLTRSPLKISEFDSHASWMGPMKGSYLKKEPEERLKSLTRARRPGTINRATFQELRAALRSGTLHHKVLSEPRLENKGVGVTIVDDEWQLEVSNILLGTGFARVLHPIQRKLVEEHDAQVASSSFPILDPKLQWLPNLYVAGSGAELQLGPPSANILGARFAAQRILA